MTIIEPAKGQPIDYAFLIQLVKAVNDLSSTVNTVAGISSVVGNGVNEKTRTSNLSVVAGQQVVTETNATTTTPISFTYTFPVIFSGKPVVTVTPMLTAESAAGKSAVVTITSVSNTSVTGSIRFSEAGVVNLMVNIIAIGTPQAYATV